MLSTIPWLRGVHLYRSCSDAHLICFWGSDARGHCFGWSHWGWWHLQLSLRVCQHIKWWVLLFYWILTLYPRFYYNHLLNFYSAFHSQFFLNYCLSVEQLQVSCPTFLPLRCLCGRLSMVCVRPGGRKASWGKKSWAAQPSSYAWRRLSYWRNQYVPFSTNMACCFFSVLLSVGLPFSLACFLDLLSVILVGNTKWWLSGFSLGCVMRVWLLMWSLTGGPPVGP